MGRLLHDGALRRYRLGYVWIRLLQLVLEGAEESGWISEMVSICLVAMRRDIETDRMLGRQKKSTSYPSEEGL